MEPIVNKVAQSGILVLDLMDFAPEAGIVEFDLADFLYKGLILKERDFRASVKEYDWNTLAGRHVAITCSVDTIMPPWAPMLVASKLDGVAATVTDGTAADARRDLFLRRMESFDWSDYDDRIVVVKGCGADEVPRAAYVRAISELQKVARKVMYGEPCSSVPLWRRPA